MSAPTMSVHAVLVIDGWAGRLEQPVLVVGETPTRYRVTPIAVNGSRTVVHLAGRGRWITVGETALVPKRSVRIAGAS